MGELSSIQKLVNSLSGDDRIELVISSTTSTGLNFADSNFSSQVLALGPFPWIGGRAVFWPGQEFNRI